MLRYLSSGAPLKLIVALLVTGAGLTFIQPPVQATTARAEGCIETNTYTFIPPLRPFNQSGTVTMTYEVMCLNADATPSPFSAGAREVIANGSGTFGYFGSCAVALMTGAFQHAILGGSVVVALNVSDTPPGFSRKLVVLQPSNPCTDAGGQVSGTGSGPAWSFGVS